MACYASGGGLAGGWKCGLRHGQGVYYCTNGEKYDGECSTLVHVINGCEL